MGSNFSKSLQPPSDDSGIEILHSDLESQATLWSLYKRWMKHYQVFRSHKEKRMRFGFFKEQVDFIHANNNMDKPYKLRLNKHSDWSKDEFEHIYVGGNSWLYAAVTAIEVVISIRTRKQIKLSDKKAFHACNMRGFCTCRGVGGDMRMVFLNKEFETTDGDLVTIDGFEEVPPNDEEALEEAVMKKQPVAAVIDARGDAFRNYAGGIFNEEFGKEPNQSVVIMACDVTSDGEKFWVILNSWGQEWGEGGYMRMKRGVNLCGIASNAVYPIKNSSSLS